MRPAIRKTLFAVLFIILFPLSCGVLVPVWRSYEMKRIILPVQGEAARDFPVALFRTDEQGVPQVQIVLYGDLQAEMEKSSADFLAPRASEKELQEQLLKATALETGDYSKPFELSFAVEEEREGKQVLRVSFAADDDEVNTGWYEARAGGIKPLRHQRVVGQLFGMKIIAEAFGTTAVLWMIGSFVLKRARDRKAAGGGEQDGGGRQSDTIDSPIVKLVNGILLRAGTDSVERLCFPTLPEGITATGEPAEGLEDFDVDDDYDPETGRPAPNNTKIYGFMNGQWRLEMALPNKIAGTVMNRILIMSNLRHWSKTPQEGTIRLTFPPGAEFPTGVDYRFRVKHDPAANRVELENITQANA